MADSEHNLIAAVAERPVRRPSTDPLARLAEYESEIARLEGLVAERDDRLIAIQEIGRAIGSTSALDEVLNLIMDKITYLMHADRSTLFLLDENGELWSKILQGTRVSEIRLRIGEGIAGWVAKTGKSLNIKDAYRDSRFNRNVDDQTGFQTRSCLCQPIRNQHRKIIGVVQVLNKRDGYFTVEDETLLSAIAGQAAVSIENSKLYLSVLAKNYELEEYRERLEHKVRELDLLYEIEREAAQALDLDSLLSSVGQKCLEAVEAQVCGITLLREGATLYSSRRIRKNDYEFDVRSLDPINDKLSEVISTGRPHLSNRGTDPESALPKALAKLGVAASSLISVPLIADDEMIGAVEVVNKMGFDDQGGRSRFDDTDLKLITLIASHISTALVTQIYRERREKAQRLSAIGQMVSGVLHDLKTPISIVSGYVQLMARQDSREARDQYAEAVLKQFDTLDRMTREILGFARGESTILIRKVLLNNFMDEAEQMLQNELMGKGIELVVDAKYRGIARFDEVKLKRVFANLARNAADAMPHGGRLHVSTASDDDNLVFTFKDTGQGVPREIQGRLFESFVTRGKKNGTGLGLAIVKKIVDEHGGSIDYDTGESGTTFTVKLPLMGAVEA